MIRHNDLGISEFKLIRKLKLMIDKHEIVLAGNFKLKIYGTLNCKSGKRMKLQNRVFFCNKEEAFTLGFRPCGNCLPEFYKTWKANFKNSNNV